MDSKIDIKMNLSATYPDQRYGVLQIDSKVSLVVLSVTLTATVFGPFYAHVSIADDNYYSQSQSAEQNFCTEEATNDNSFKAFYCTDRKPRMSQRIIVWGLKPDTVATVSHI